MTGESLTEALRETLAVFDSDRPLTTSEVTDALDVGRRSTYDRLDKLVDRGYLETKEVGARGRVWWRTRSETVDGESDEPAGGAGATDELFTSLIDAVEEYAIFLLDTDGTVTTWNPGAEQIKGYERDEILGESFSTFYTEEAIAQGVPEQNLDAAAENGSVEDEGWRVRKDGSRFWANVIITAIYDDDTLRGYAKVTRDMSDRRRFEQRLRRQRDALESELDEVFERVDDAFFALDEDWQFTYATDQMAELVDRSVDEMLGASVEDVLPEFAGGQPRRMAENAVETQESVEFEFYAERLSAWVEASAYPSETGLSVYARDVTERRERERDLEQYETVTRSASDVIVSIDAESTIRMVNPAVEEMFGYDSDDLIGEPLTKLMPERFVEGHNEGVQRYLRSGERALDWDSVELPGVHADGHEIPLTISFSEYEHEGERFFAGIIRDVTEQTEREHELRRQRERYETLDNLNVVVREITDAVIEQPTRGEIERTLCEKLASLDSYEFAWIGGVDAASETVQLRAEAGVEGYLDETTISVNPEDPRSQGPTGRAVQTHEMQVVEDVFSNPQYEEWRDRARDYGFKTSAAIPIVHENTIYGVLNVYASRTEAFTGKEGDVISQLGEVVGHAIAAVERKRALMSDEVVELEFVLPDVLDALGVAVPAGGRMTVTQTVPTSNDKYLVYGTVNQEGVEIVEGMTESLPHWGGLLFLDETGDLARFQVRVSEPTVLSMIASQGGSIEEAVLEDGDFHLQLHLVPGNEVRQIIDTLQEEYPDAEMLSRRQITRPDDASGRFHQSLEGELTNRQYTTLQAAYNGGFFEWPRVNSGKEIADAMDVAPPTFHQHLRKAEQKVLSSVLAKSPE